MYIILFFVKFLKEDLTHLSPSICLLDMCWTNFEMMNNMDGIKQWWATSEYVVEKVLNLTFIFNFKFVVCVCIRQQDEGSASAA